MKLTSYIAFWFHLSTLILVCRLSIFCMMSHHKNRTLILALLSSHLFGLHIIVSDHLHYGMPGLHSEQNLVAHDCGSKEKHQVLDLNHVCVLCARSNNPVYFVSENSNFSDLTFARLSFVERFMASTPGFRNCAPNRGPPAPVLSV